MQAGAVSSGRWSGGGSRSFSVADPAAELTLRQALQPRPRKDGGDSGAAARAQTD